ncbi:MAG: hypothetical protein HKN26_03965 [Acidimicrobiales bacterium]|nr:hypothetical protein [Acidimicrobiales bacterium]
MTAVDGSTDTGLQLSLDPEPIDAAPEASDAMSGVVAPAWESRVARAGSSLAQFYPRSRGEAQLRRRFTAGTLGALAIFAMFATPALGLPALLVALFFLALLGVFCAAWWQRNQVPSLAPTVQPFPLPSEMTVRPRTQGAPLQRRRAG